MPGPRARVTISLERDGGLPQDVCVNTLYFEGDTLEATSVRESWDNEIENCIDRVEDFYQAMAGTLGRQLTGNVTYRAYDMADPQPAPPRSIRTGVLTVSDTGLPAEVCAVLKFAAYPAAGKIQARRRGRIYFGPLSAGWLSFPSGAPDMRIDNTTGYGQQLAQQAYDHLHQGAGLNGFRHAVFSPTTLAGGDDDEAWNDVDFYTVDNAFDTQRRRGAKATSNYNRP